MYLREFMKKHKMRSFDVRRLLRLSPGYFSQLLSGRKIPSDKLASDIVGFTKGQVTYDELKNPSVIIYNKKPYRVLQFFHSSRLGTQGDIYEQAGRLLWIKSRCRGTSDLWEIKEILPIDRSSIAQELVKLNKEILGGDL